MKKFLVFVSCLLLLAACNNKGVNNSESQLDSNSSILSEEEKYDKSENIKSTEELLANEKNEAGNGYIIINDPNDYPTYIKDLRFGEIQTTDSTVFLLKDVYNNIKFMSYDAEDSNFLLNVPVIFNDGLAPFVDAKTGKLGYIDINGKFVINPIFKTASHFKRGIARVSESKSDETNSDDDLEYYYIDTNGNKTEDTYNYGTYTLDLSNYDKNSTSNITFDHLVYTPNYATISDENTPIKGYVDRKNNFHQIKNAINLFNFCNDYALIENDDFEYYFIDNNFNRVTGNLNDIINCFNPIDYIAFTSTIHTYPERDPETVYTYSSWGYDSGFEYIHKGGYFTFMVRTSEPDIGYNYEYERKVVKICPELYNEESNHE